MQINILSTAQPNYIDSTSAHCNFYKQSLNEVPYAKFTYLQCTTHCIRYTLEHTGKHISKLTFPRLIRSDLRKSSGCKWTVRVLYQRNAATRFQAFSNELVCHLASSSCCVTVHIFEIKLFCFLKTIGMWFSASRI